MNKKLICFLSFILMVSFSTGIFARFLTNDQASLSAQNINFWQGLLSACKGDFLITIIALVLSFTMYTIPLLALYITAQVFSLGFAAAYLLSAHPQGFPIVCAVLLPRCLLKIPVYMALFVLAFDTAKSRHGKRHKQIPWERYAICMVILMLSSLLEAGLHLLIVSP